MQRGSPWTMGALTSQRRQTRRHVTRDRRSTQRGAGRQFHLERAAAPERNVIGHAGAIKPEGRYWRDSWCRSRESPWPLSWRDRNTIGRPLSDLPFNRRRAPKKIGGSRRGFLGLQEATAASVNSQWINHAVRNNRRTSQVTTITELPAAPAFSVAMAAGQKPANSLNPPPNRPASKFRPGLRVAPLRGSTPPQWRRHEMP